MVVAVGGGGEKGLKEDIEEKKKKDEMGNSPFVENLLMTEGDRVFTYYQSLLKKMEVLEEKYAKSLEARVEDEGELDPCPTIPRDSGGV